MKKLLFAFLLLVSTQIGYAQWSHEWSLGYAYSSPTGKMKQNIARAHGGVLDLHFISPDKKFALGTDLNYSIYGFDKTSQKYTFSDGSTADMDIQVSNTFFNLMASGRYYLITGKRFSPYLGLKAGYSWFVTDLNIYDPDDFDSCKPVETDMLQEDGTWIYSLGGGLQYDMSSVFQKLNKDVLLISVSAFYTQGGSVDYMNTDVPDGHTSSPPNRTSDMEATFINTQTQVIHKHHIGYVYSSFAQMMDIRFTITLRNSK